MNAFGHADLVDWARELPPSVLADNGLALDQMAEHLPHEEGVAVGLGVDRPSQRPSACAGIGAGGDVDDGLNSGFVETRQRQPLDVWLAAEVGEHFRERVCATELGVAIGAGDAEG